MEKISEIRNENLRLIMYAMLLHSKRYSLQNGVFYMSYKQISEMVGLTCEKNILSSVNKLIENNFIEVLDRNVSQKGSIKKKPNRYKLNIQHSNNEEYFSLDYDNSSINLQDSHVELLVKLVPIEKLKLNLPKKQYLSIRKLYQVS